MLETETKALILIIGLAINFLSAMALVTFINDLGLRLIIGLMIGGLIGIIWAYTIR